MKILHIITGLQTGGAERMLVKLVQESRDSLQHCVISLGGIGSQGPILQDTGIEVHALDIPGVLMAPIFIKRLTALVKTYQPDLIQGWMYHGNLAGLAAARIGSRIPLVFNIRQSLDGYSSDKWTTRQVIRLNARLSGATDRVIYNSQLSRVQHEEIGFHKDVGRTIPNGFDLETFRRDHSIRSKVRSELGLNDTTRLVVQIGRNHPMKDHGNFIKAAKLVRDKIESCHFLLAGRGIETDPELISLVEEFELEGAITLAGNIEYVEEIWNAADIGVLSSAWGEGFPNVIGEAMACEVPCVVTNVGDSSYLVGETGAVVAPGSDTDLGEALAKMLRMSADELQALGVRARSRIKAEFSIKAISSQYLSLYGEILNRPCAE